MSSVGGVREVDVVAKEKTLAGKNQSQIERESRERSPRDNIPEDHEPKSFEIETEELDPRVQLELEKLNTCTDEINNLEVQLDDANTVFRSLLTDSTHHLKSLSKKLGSCIEKARPYYEALDVSTKAQAECQKAAVQFQRAAGMHAAAKETISLAEERFSENSGDWQFDNAWQEMLNHATIKVMDAEKQRTASEKEHLARCAFLTESERTVKKLEKKLSRHIDKSKPYFEQKDIFNKALASEKARIQALQTKICNTKAQYAQSLRNLEEISESIHARRKIKAEALPDQGEMDSLQYDLEHLHMESRSVSRAESSLMSECDSALGSTSVLGSREPITEHSNDAVFDETDAGNLIDSSGNLIDSSRNVIDSSRNVIDSSGNLIDSSRNVIDSLDNMIDSSLSVPRSMSLPEQLDQQVLAPYPGSPSASVINAAILHHSGSDASTSTDQV